MKGSWAKSADPTVKAALALAAESAPIKSKPLTHAVLGGGAAGGAGGAS